MGQTVWGERLFGSALAPLSNLSHERSRLEGHRPLQATEVAQSGSAWPAAMGLAARLSKIPTIQSPAAGRYVQVSVRIEGGLWPHSCRSPGYVRGSAPRQDQGIDGFRRASPTAATSGEGNPRPEPSRHANHRRSSDAGALPYLWRARPNAVLHVYRQTHHPLAWSVRCALAAGAGSRVVRGRWEGTKRA